MIWGTPVINFVCPMNKSAKIYIAGQKGLVGSALCRKLQCEGYKTLITLTRKELDLTSQQAVTNFFRGGKARICLSGSGKGRRYPGEQHLPGRLHLRKPDDIGPYHSPELPHRRRKAPLPGKFLYFPTPLPQPMKEECLMTSPLGQTNAP